MVNIIKDKVLLLDYFLCSGFLLWVVFYYYHAIAHSFAFALSSSKLIISSRSIALLLWHKAAFHEGNYIKQSNEEIKTLFQLLVTLLANPYINIVLVLS